MIAADFRFLSSRLGVAFVGAALEELRSTRGAFDTDTKLE